MSENSDNSIGKLIDRGLDGTAAMNAAIDALCWRTRQDSNL